MNFSVNTINALSTIFTNKKPFYASDYQLNGGIISALAHHGLIEKTGRTKEIMVDIGEYPYNRKNYVKCTVYKWKPSEKNLAKTIKRLYNEAEKLNALADALINANC